MVGQRQRGVKLIYSYKQAAAASQHCLADLCRSHVIACGQANACNQLRLCHAQSELGNKGKRSSEELTMESRFHNYFRVKTIVVSAVLGLVRIM